MARHKDILKSHHPEMLFTFDEESNFVSVSNSQASGFYLDENVYQNMAHATIFRVNNDGYDYGYNTKTIVPNERFSTFASYSFGGKFSTGNRSDMSLDVEVDPECMTSPIGNFSASFQINIPDLSGAITNTMLNNESFKRYQLLMVRVKDNLILGRGEFGFNKNAMTFNVAHNLLYEPNLTTTKTVIDDVTGEEKEVTEFLQQKTDIAFMLIYDRLRYTRDNKIRDNEWNNSNYTVVDKFYNEIVGSYLYLDPNPLHDNGDTDCTPNDVLSYWRYHTPSYDNLPVNKSGYIAYTQIQAFKGYTLILNRNMIDIAGSRETVSYPTKYPENDFNSFKINIHSVASTTKGGSDFPRYEYIEYPDGYDIPSDIYWTHATKSVNLTFHVSLNRIPQILKFSNQSTSSGSSIWYDVVALNNFKICARPVGSSVRIGVVINGYNTPAFYDIIDKSTYHFVVNYNRTLDSQHKITMYVNGEVATLNSNVPTNAKFVGSLIKENDNSIHIGTDGYVRPYIFTKSLGLDASVQYSALPTGTWGTITSSIGEYGFVNILPIKLSIDNIAIYNGKQFTQDQARELHISSYSYNDILNLLGLSHRYQFKTFNNWYSYSISLNTYSGWVRKVIDTKTWSSSDSYSSSYTNNIQDDSLSLMIRGSCEIVKVDDHGVFDTAIKLFNNGHLTTRNNLLYSSNAQTTSFWINTESNRKQTIMSCVNHNLPFAGISLYMQSGYITLDFGNKTVTTRTSYADGKWHRIVLQFKPHTNATSNKDGFIRLIVDQNFTHQFDLATTSGYTNSDYTEYWKMRIGNDLVGDLGYNGLIGDIQVFDKIIDPYYLNYLYQNKQYFTASGTVYFNNLPTNTKVRIYNHLNGKLLTQTQTDDMGYFEYKNEETYTIDVVVLDNRNYMENYQTFTGIIINSK